MRIVFLSLFYNHHQAELCNCISSHKNIDFVFFQSVSMTEDRIKLGWNDGLVYPDYVYTEDKLDEIKSLIESADAVIFGSAPFELIKHRVDNGGLTFVYSERLFKDYNIFKNCFRALKYRLMWRNKSNCYLLSAGRYAASDYKFLYLFRDRMYKWGYFPPLKIYDDVNKLIESKRRNTILWVGRFLKWKHPEIAISIAEKLKSNNIEFHLNIIGDGDMSKSLQKRIYESGLNDSISLLSSMSPDKVRMYMEKSEILLFSSDRGEGWGAVLNEGMNSCCISFASLEAGSTTYLIENGVNGYCYNNDSIDEVVSHIIELFSNDTLRREIALKAYQTIIGNWNAKIASERLIDSINAIKSNQKIDYKNGVFSEA